MLHLSSGWNGLHPLVIHFPIALLLLAPLFVLLGAVLRSGRRRIFLISALLLILGTASLYVATQTGHAACRQHQFSTQANAVLLEHRALADETRTMFTMVTALCCLMLLVTLRFRVKIVELAPVLPIAFLVFYAIGIALLLSTAYRGALLVHKFGL
jgi:uncharacterized membrane protein